MACVNWIILILLVWNKQTLVQLCLPAQATCVEHSKSSVITDWVLKVCVVKWAFLTWILIFQNGGNQPTEDVQLVKTATDIKKKLWNLWFHNWNVYIKSCCTLYNKGYSIQVLSGYSAFVIACHHHATEPQHWSVMWWAIMEDKLQAA